MELYLLKITEKSSTITKVKKAKAHGKFVSFKIKNFNNIAEANTWVFEKSFSHSILSRRAFLKLFNCFAYLEILSKIKHQQWW